MRQAFVHAFLPSSEREALLKRVDAQVFALVPLWVESLRDPTAREPQLRLAQRSISHVIPPGISLADELIAARRADNAREEMED